jgi:hypothetical protein
MSANSESSAPVLCVGYAHKSCTAEQVASAFNAVLEQHIVEKVDSIDKTKDTTGETFKMFFVHFKENSTRLNQMMFRIETDSYFPIVYGTRFDKKKNEQVDCFWKITRYVPKDKAETFVPRILSVEEAQIAGIKAPKKL